MWHFLKYIMKTPTKNRSPASGITRHLEGRVSISFQRIEPRLFRAFAHHPMFPCFCRISISLTRFLAKKKGVMNRAVNWILQLYHQQDQSFPMKPFLCTLPITWNTEKQELPLGQGGVSSHHCVFVKVGIRLPQPCDCFIHYRPRGLFLESPENFSDPKSELPNCNPLDFKRWLNYRIQGQHIQIAQNLLVNKTNNNSSFCYSMIRKWVSLYSTWFRS